MWSPSALASTLNTSKTSSSHRLGLVIGSLLISSLTKSNSTATASGKRANVPCPSTADHAKCGPRNGLTCCSAPATKQKRPKADLSARPVTPPDAWCFSIHSVTHLTFLPEIPFLLSSTSSWYPIHWTVKPPRTFFQDSGTSTSSSTNSQKSIFLQKYSPNAVSQPSSAKSKWSTPSSLPPSRCINRTTPAARRCQWYAAEAIPKVPLVCRKISSLRLFPGSLKAWYPQSRLSTGTNLCALAISYSSEHLKSPGCSSTFSSTYVSTPDASSMPGNLILSKTFILWFTSTEYDPSWTILTTLDPSSLGTAPNAATANLPLNSSWASASDGPLLNLFHDLPFYVLRVFFRRLIVASHWILEFLFRELQVPLHLLFKYRRYPRHGHVHTEPYPAAHSLLQPSRVFVSYCHQHGLKPPEVNFTLTVALLPLWLQT